MIIKLVGVLAVAMLSGCAMVSSPVGNGALFTSVKGPIVATDLSAASKTGEACAQNILGLVVSGDASITAAKRAGSISKVASIDHNSISYLGLYSQFCTQVTGE